MSGWQRIYYKLLNLPLRVLVKSKSIPAEPAQELGLDTSRPVMYVLPYNSKADLLTLRAQCLAHDLPDPLEPLEIDGALLPRYVFIHGGPRVFTYYTPKEESIKLFHDYLDLHRNHPDLDVQMVPVSVMFGRSPGREKGEVNPPLRMLNGIQKFFAVSWLGRDSFVRFSPSVSLRRMADEHGTDKIIAQKLARVARMHFARQRLAAVGPRLPARQDLFNKLLASKAIARAVEDEARSKKISHEKAQQNAIALMEEIAANFSYEMIRLTDRILGFTWNRLYQGINVHNAERVRQLAHDGHEIVYVPCHRSHMDYLLLSYVLYHQGLVPPHIAAGINLNFWPAGPIFRRLGAFFIRRTFKGNKLYSTVFREYLGELFSRGYSVEYFVEGGRSRTGRLLDPKTGTLSMTIQAMLRGGTRPITLVPIYIGYEHVMEVGTYAKELRGATKEKESLPQMVRGLSKLRNLGQGYVNFGEPLPLMTYLNHHVPEWREAIDPIEAIRPSWLTPTVNNIAADLMVRINNAGAANANTKLAGEIIGILAAPNPAEAKAGLAACVDMIENVCHFVSANEDDTIVYYAHCISRTGSYLSEGAGIAEGEALAYLIAPPLEAMYGVDAALKAADVRLCVLYAPPSETNFGGGLLTGSQSACKSACDAFAAAVEFVADNPID
mgnify:CR=1 FL=1